MKSVRYYKANDIRIEDMPVPEPVGDQVRIKIKCAAYAALTCMNILTDRS